MKGSLVALAQQADLDLAFSLTMLVVAAPATLLARMIVSYFCKKLSYI
ncbi:hypothetical protein [Cellvibrio sp. UBA7661]